MDVLLMVLYCAIVLGFLVVIHEGGHYLAARCFGVRVTEFMIGLPGPNIGFIRHGTKFGITAIPLGGYARICGMEPGKESPHLCDTLALVYERGTLNMEDVALALNISNDDAYAALDELVEWGSIRGPRKSDTFNTYRTTALETRGACAASAEGDSRPLDDPQAFYESERAQQYRCLPFWKRCIILLAGPFTNLLFAMVVFVIVYSVVGFDIQSSETGVVTHMTIDPLRSIWVGFNYIGMVLVAVVGLFNPQTAADTVSNSTSIMGIAVLSKSAAEQGLLSFIMFTAMLSVSLGIMNMIPIPPLDGGRFLVEIYQKISRRAISLKALNSISMAGVMLFVVFFIIMLNQDVQRFIFGNWG